MLIYRIMNEETGTVLPDPIFGKDKAIEQANDLKNKAKGKAEFRVISTVPVYTTKENKDKEADIDF